MLLEWVNPVYLDISYQEQIQEEFEENSEIQLKDFLKVNSCFYFAYFFMWTHILVGLICVCPQDEKFREVSEALRLTQIQWTRRGPPNKR